MGDIDEGFEDDHDCPGTSCLRCAKPIAMRICDHKSHPWPCGPCWDEALAEQKKRYDEAVVRLGPEKKDEPPHLMASQLWARAVVNTTVERAERDRLVREGVNSLVTSCQQRVLAALEYVARTTDDRTKVPNGVFMNLDDWFNVSRPTGQLGPVRKAIVEATVVRLRALGYTVQEDKRSDGTVYGLNLGGW